MEVTKFKLHKYNSGPEGAPPTWHVAIEPLPSVLNDGTLSLVPDCVTEQDVDYWFGKLISELQELKARAKQVVRSV